MLYGSETLDPKRKSDIENLKKEEGKIARKILGLATTENGYGLNKDTKV